MRTIITTNPDGQPFTQLDVEQLQLNISELTTALSKQLSGSSDIVRLYGAEVSVTGSGGLTPTLSITKGAIWYLNEIYMVDAVVSQAIASGTTVETVKANWSWDLKEDTNVAGGNRVFEDNIARPTFSNRTAVYKAVPVNWPPLSYNSSPLIASLITASQTETSEGISDTKYVTPATLGRQGDSFTVAYPDYTSGGTYYGSSKYKNGYFQSVNVDGVFTMTSDQSYVDIILSFPLIVYGYTAGFFSIPASVTASGYFPSYVNLVGEFISQSSTTVLRLHRPMLTEGLYLNSGADGRPKFKAGTTYAFTFNTTK